MSGFLFKSIFWFLPDWFLNLTFHLFPYLEWEESSVVLKIKKEITKLHVKSGFVIALGEIKKEKNEKKTWQYWAAWQQPAGSEKQLLTLDWVWALPFVIIFTPPNAEPKFIILHKALTVALITSNFFPSPSYLYFLSGSSRHLNFWPWLYRQPFQSTYRLNSVKHNYSVWVFLVALL